MVGPEASLDVGPLSRVELRLGKQKNEKKNGRLVGWSVVAFEVLAFWAGIMVFLHVVLYSSARCSVQFGFFQ